MRLCYPSISIFTFCICLGLYQSPAQPAIPELNPKILILAQTSAQKVDPPPLLKPGSTGPDVQTLQTQLKELGYYNGAVDGQFTEPTKIAVSQFQTAQGLLADGIVGITTWKKLQAAIASKPTIITAPVPTSKPRVEPQPSKKNLIWWSVLGLGTLGNLVAVIYCLRWLHQVKQMQESQAATSNNKPEADKHRSIPQLPESTNNPLSASNSPSVTTSTPKLLPAETTSRLAKFSIVDELINDLYSADPAKRHKAIWDLGQQGDSRAIEPLVDLIIDADSQQHSLILSALGEIAIRTFKPINRALAISMQNQNPQVRQNAIRDLTRVYDMMSQITPILRHALEDTDPEVQSTARYALKQLNRIRVVSEQESLPEQQEKDG
ncbi:peptidoglycan-binding protein [Tolypothrix sp. PCC 7910]|nr:peptidoglycan-binding protein [Tolypothrix sp. PCC 7910]QIR39955.1 peptidoglycan-binding protein [Tolypothrix sp. PCC 7910]